MDGTGTIFEGGVDAGVPPEGRLAAEPLANRLYIRGSTVNHNRRAETSSGIACGVNVDDSRLTVIDTIVSHNDCKIRAVSVYQAIITVTSFADALHTMKLCDAIVRGSPPWADL